MIIRIMGHGQYHVPETLLEEINAIDNEIVRHVGAGDEAAFRKDLARLASAIRERGRPVEIAEIVGSDIIVPPEDMTLEEAKRVFSGSGLIED